MNTTTITMEEFLDAAIEFVQISDKICDGWTLKENKTELHKTYLRKDTFIQNKEDNKNILLKIEYVIFYHLSYGVPAFSFNIWNSSGTFLSLEDVRNMTIIQLNQKEFYSVITQQEHPIFQRPYFIVHPCHTETLLATFRNKTKNMIVTFLGLITLLMRINLPLEYGL